MNIALWTLWNVPETPQGIGCKAHPEQIAKTFRVRRLPTESPMAMAILELLGKENKKMTARQMTDILHAHPKTLSNLARLLCQAGKLMRKVRAVRVGNFEYQYWISPQGE